MAAGPTRLTRQGLPSQVANQVRDRIVHGTLVPGDRLPTEREMAEQHGVSRAVIREAVAKLIHEGLVTSRQGVGAFVASPDAASTLVLDPGSFAEPRDFKHLYELRLVLECGAAELAARNCDASDIKAIEDAIAKMRGVEESREIYVQHDISFHRAVAAASKNPFVAMFISFVDRKLQESIFVALHKLDFATTTEVSIAEHCAILDRIRDRDPAAAAAAMQSHLNNSSRRLGI